MTKPTEGSYRAIWALTWPQMIMMVFHFMIGFVDVWVAGRIESRVQASLGMITQLTFFFLVVAMAVANGGVAAISQSMGAGLMKRVKRYVGMIIEVSVICSGLILAIGLGVDNMLLSLLRVPAEIEPIAGYFLGVYLLVLPSYYLLIVTNAVFRAQKRVFVPLFAMVSVTCVNTIGDLGLGLGWFGMPEIGYKGLAWSTFASVTAGMIFNMVVLARTGLLCRGSFPPWRWIKKALPYLYKVAWPGGLTQVIWQSAYMVLFAITASLPEGSITALAGMTAGVRVESFLFLPGFAFSLSAGILMGQSVGEGRFDLARSYILRILTLGNASIVVLTLLVWLVVWPVTGFIAPDPAVQAEAVNYLRYNMLAIPFTLTTMILAGAMSGAGATLFNLVNFTIGAWLVRLPLAWFLGHAVLASATGIWIAMLVSQVFQSAFGMYIFQFWNWTRFAMRKKPRTNNGEVHDDVRTHQPGSSGRI